MDRNVWIPLLVAVLSLVGTVGVWRLNEGSEREEAAYLSREERYAKMVATIHGFYEETPSVTLREEFIKQLELAWLYCPDDVIRKGYAFLHTVSDTSNVPEAEQQAALGEFLLAIREDLLMNKRVKSTRLTAGEFELLGPRVTPSEGTR
jgi:hypothetical protein